MVAGGDRRRMGGATRGGVCVGLTMCMDMVTFVCYICRETATVRDSYSYYIRTYQHLIVVLLISRTEICAIKHSPNQTGGLDGSGLGLTITCTQHFTFHPLHGSTIWYLRVTMHRLCEPVGNNNIHACTPLPARSWRAYLSW